MLPVLYSFRRCPFAIRARMTLAYAGIDYELREVSLKAKPPALLDISEKATVPTMVLPDMTLLDESTDIITWALQQNDPDHWLSANRSEKLRELMTENDSSFKRHLDLYKYADRYPQHPASSYRASALGFLEVLETCLQNTPNLSSDHLSVADVHIFPFIRQFAFVDKHWFDQAPFPALQRWLQSMLDSDLFKNVMDKHSLWCEGDTAVVISH